MRFNSLALGLTLASAALLSACGGGGGSSKTNVRLLNASVGFSSLDLAHNASGDSSNINAKIAYGAVGSYGSVDTGSTAMQVQNSVNGSAVTNLTPTLAGDSNYTVIAYGWSGAVKTTLLQEAETAPDANKAKLLLLNLAADAGALDLYVNPANSKDSLSGQTPVATNIVGSSGYTLLNSGAFRLTLTGTGKPTDIRMDLPSVTLDSATVSTLVATSTSGGKLVNGIVLKQQGAATNYPTTAARARVVNGVAGTSTSVSATLNGTVLFPSAQAPAVGQYFTTSAGASTLSVNVNGSPVTFAAPTLTAGGDYSLLVSGTAAAPVLSVVADDNRLPTASGMTKIRLFNGLASSTAGAGMTVDYAPAASNVLPGSASTPSSILGNSNVGSLVTVTLPNVDSSWVNSKSNVLLSANAVYTVFVLGDPVKPYNILINREDLAPLQ
ncbi:hypothetical protein HNP55_004581 [Paucibacter oligotrophus]|uniref:DUF4397 domain-containing protein n=1 Tax=Roseateles oligotrophus TaxID=1769250 RepID=A0A840LL51_9BURK|nr:DUF4397 domain-containing protein [Roseateles oligotrophus]MBB4846027.1 hypothetical protein [Roseateles oligotrophus]